MASEYLKWKYRDVRPDEPPPEKSRKERAANWFYYNKWWLVMWAILLAVLGSILWNFLGIGKVRPDYIFAYVGTSALPDDCAAALEREFAALGEDVNGDGQVTVELRQYVSGSSESDPESALSRAYAASVTLAADITAGDSHFFLVEDPAQVQKSYLIFTGPDGAMPETDDYSIDGRVFRWEDCPVLSGLELGEYQVEALGHSVTGSCQELLSGLYFGRRGFYDEKQASGREADGVLWNLLTEGAVS